MTQKGHSQAYEVIQLMRMSCMPRPYSMTHIDKSFLKVFSKMQLNKKKTMIVLTKKLVVSYTNKVTLIN